MRKYCLLVAVGLCIVLAAMASIATAVYQINNCRRTRRQNNRNCITDCNLQQRLI